jgi:acetyl esterase/lipase
MSLALDTLRSWFRPLLAALLPGALPLATRLRLLLLQPISLLTYAISAAPWLLSRRRPYRVVRLPVARGRRVRALVFEAPGGKGGEGRRRPLHVDVHGGAFLGGLPEGDANFCAAVAEKTGAVVVSTSYRYAPEHVFPAAVEDVEAVIAYLLDHADEYGVDPGMLSVSGFSAGGNLVLAAAQQERCRAPAPTAVKAAVAFYAPVRRPSLLLSG